MGCHLSRDGKNVMRGELIEEAKLGKYHRSDLGKVKGWPPCLISANLQWIPEYKKHQVDECEAKADEDSYTCTSCCLVITFPLLRLNIQNSGLQGRYAPPSCDWLSSWMTLLTMLQCRLSGEWLWVTLATGYCFRVQTRPLWRKELLSELINPYILKSFRNVYFCFCRALSVTRLLRGEIPHF